MPDAAAILTYTVTDNAPDRGEDDRRAKLYGIGD